MLILFVLILICADAQVLPTCRYTCSDPVCDAVCTPVCNATDCQALCMSPPNAVCGAPSCRTVCPDTLPNTTVCPQCETQCSPLHCSPSDAVCQIVCAPPSCGWQCQKPTDCPPPICILQCEHPLACEYSSASTIAASVVLLLIAILIV